MNLKTIIRIYGTHLKTNLILNGKVILIVVIHREHYRFLNHLQLLLKKSNQGYKWDFDETKLAGKICVIVFREEEWYNPDGDLKILVKPDEVRSLEALSEGRIKIKPRKTIDKPTTSTSTTNDPFASIASSFDISNDDLPF